MFLLNSIFEEIQSPLTLGYIQLYIAVIIIHTLQNS